MRVILACCMLMLIVAACDLNGDRDDSPTLAPINQPLPLTLTAQARGTATQTPAITPSPSPTTATGSTTGGTTGGTTGSLPNCFIRTDWFIYTVAAGDTLGQIAQRINSTINELVLGNCLGNPELIFVGQQLRLPRLPAQTTTTTGTTTGTTGTTTTTGTTSTTTGGTTGTTTGGTTGTTTGTTTGGTTGTTTGGTTGSTTGGTTGSTGTPPQFSQTLIAAPVIAAQNGVVTLQPTIQLDAGVLLDADRVRFYANEAAEAIGAVNIGTDFDPFDGTRLNYTFNEFDDQLFFWAIAENEFGLAQSNILLVIYNPDYLSNTVGNITITPNIGFDGALYTLQAGAVAALNWTDAPSDATRIDFYFMQGGEQTSTILIGTDPNPRDGAVVGWVVPANLLGTIRAQAVFPNGTTRDSGAYNVFSTAQ